MMKPARLKAAATKVKRDGRRPAEQKVYCDRVVMDFSAVLWIERARRAVPLLRKLRRSWLSLPGREF